MGLSCQWTLLHLRLLTTHAMLPVSRFPALLAASAGALLMLLQTSSGQEDVVGLAVGSDSILSAPYVDSFSCEGQAYGYFADVQNNCEVFHICYPLTDETGRITEYLKWSFFCGTGPCLTRRAWCVTTPRTPSPARSRPRCTARSSTAGSTRRSTRSTRSASVILSLAVVDHHTHTEIK